jgi:hypothetical protein
LKIRVSVVRFRPRPPPLQTARHHGGPFSFPAWLVGRLAFPLFGLSFALTLNPQKALQTARRLAIAGSAIQPIYAIAFANSGSAHGGPATSCSASPPSPTWWNWRGTRYSPRSQDRSPSSRPSPSSFGLAGIVWLFALHRFLNPQPDNTAACPAPALVAFFMQIPGMPIANALIAAAIAAIKK